MNGQSGGDDTHDPPRSLGLRAGEWVEVRSKQEILSTLDKQARLDGMPFMPEMFRHCGGRFRVSKRAAKSCDTVQTGEGRRVDDAVHLEGLRCDGSAHGDCQALCLFWWREAWLKRVDDRASSDASKTAPDRPTRCREEDVIRHAKIPGFISADVYSCQVTRLLEFTHGMRWWDPRALWRELHYGNVTLSKMLTTAWKMFLNILRRKTGRRPKPNIQGRCTTRTPAGKIDGLRPGDMVVVKSQEAIEATLNAAQRNRGLFFDIEMLPYCGRRMRLLQKVERIIDEKTGVMRRLPNDCWIIEGAVCTGYRSRNRLFCTREIYPFWREIWFERVEDPESESESGGGGPSASRAVTPDPGGA